MKSEGLATEIKILISQLAETIPIYQSNQLTSTYQNVYAYYAAASKIHQEPYITSS
jgi:hypothetical protein